MRPGAPRDPGEGAFLALRPCGDILGMLLTPRCSPCVSHGGTGSRRRRCPTPSPTHHGQQGALLEAGVEGDELGLRVLLAPQESAARGGKAAVSVPTGPVPPPPCCRTAPGHTSDTQPGVKGRLWLRWGQGQPQRKGF